MAGSSRLADTSRSEPKGSTGVDGNDGHLPNTLRDGSIDFVTREDSVSSLEIKGFYFSFFLLNPLPH